MASNTNTEKVGWALLKLRDGLAPYVERELKARYGDEWEAHLDAYDGQQNPLGDISVLLGTMIGEWSEVFRKVLGNAERSLVGELKEFRNRWAHQESFDYNDAYRCLDSVERLLRAISAADLAEEVTREMADLRHKHAEAERRTQQRLLDARASALPEGLIPWRMVVYPHADVREGRLEASEFAADLHRVFRGDADAEYQDPKEFYRRTYITEGLRQLLKEALERLAGEQRSGSPVVQLKTNFGGGKTHSMLALYHLFSGEDPSSLPGVPELMQQAGVTALPKVRRAVLVGTALSPASPTTYPDGTQANTFWGVMAYQLLGREGYALVEEADKRGVNPGRERLEALFQKAAPCLVLVDEWVAFVRQLYTNPNLPAGTFDANMTFAQALTEAVSAVPHAMLVVSLPESEAEIGGEGGAAALDRLGRIVSRVESVWRPANMEESFEIVRRRLFEEITDPQRQEQRDLVVRAYAQFYRRDSEHFPAECRTPVYEERLRRAYPIHPELFERLYSDWSTLERFQRTRGVLRLMANVIYVLWQNNDTSSLILPGLLPISDSLVSEELARCLEEHWQPILESDVDGPHACSAELDRQRSDFGNLQACTRVARTLFLGSAPTYRTAHRGLSKEQILLGCCQPKERIAVYKDALSLLADRSTHLYHDETRYWYSVQPNLNRTAEDLANNYSEEEVLDGIKNLLREKAPRPDPFKGIHIAPVSSNDIPDERSVRLVILGPTKAHSRKNMESDALKEAENLLHHRGNTQRRYKNTLVFLAPDSAKLRDLKQAARNYMAWKQIVAERESRNLDPMQARQAQEQERKAKQTLDEKLLDAYQWLLTPSQQVNNLPQIEWHEHSLSGGDALVQRAHNKLINEEELAQRLAGSVLRDILDGSYDVSLWQDRDAIPVQQLADYFAEYLYLPRLQSEEVLKEAIADGVRQLTWASDTFAYAPRYDEQKHRYENLRAGEHCEPELSGWVVRPEVAQRQLEEERSQTASPTIAEYHVEIESRGHFRVQEPSKAPAIYRRFYGSVLLDPRRPLPDVDKISREIVQHLAAASPDVRIKIRLEIEAEYESGFPDDLRSVVMENCRTLRFENESFEE
ncbi:MAG TPA: DUF499 domain-containing protein [Chthonomonas sp.]|uniref:DUF499 domain-containing protein n=1 Tax=Chthonomonas sp. TaxID=2282153 RepID=UPI002B4ACAF5|nr:DUF499 domain-containing protein [Chthonomonas sp.]HLI49734.1 DUF499 domain-containing protein [Chthonomonas sp.]